MKPEQTRRAVLEALERGEIPKGGPSELAAYGLLDDTPADYWERWGKESEQRIRAAVRESRCRCQTKPESVTADSRCGRCLGRRGGRDG